MIITLSTQTLYRGIAYIILKDQSAGRFPSWFAKDLGYGSFKLFGLDVPIIHADEAPAIDAHARARELLDQGSSARDAAKRLAFEANLPRKQAYEVVLQASSEMTEKANDA